MQPQFLGRVAAIATLLVAAPTASAGVRFASPAGTGPEPCSLLAPCAFGAAVSGATAGDAVRLLPGSFTFDAPVNIAVNDLTIEGQPGAPPPAVTYTGPSSNSAIVGFGTRLTLRGFALSGTTDGATPLVNIIGFTTNATVDRMVARNLGAGRVILARVATVRDSVIVASAASGPAAVLTGTITGSTIIGDFGPASRALIVEDSFLGAGAHSLTIRNSILRGGGGDLNVIASAPNTVTVDIDYSAYRPGGAVASGDGATLTEGGHNVTKEAALASVTGGADIHQLGGSPTIDAGNPADAIGSTGDFEGDIRVLGAAPDIGADEVVPAPGATTGAATGVSLLGATLNGTVNPNGAETRVTFEYGPTTAYGATTPEVVVPAGVTPVPVVAVIDHLTPATTFHVRVVAASTAGSATGADATFSTLAVPAVGPITLSPARIRPGRRTKATFSLSGPATLNVVIERLRPGRRKGSACLPTGRTGPRCTKIVRRGAFTATRTAGTTVTVAIPARLGGRPLAPGRYRITITPTSAEGNIPGTARATLLVVVQR